MRKTSVAAKECSARTHKHIVCHLTVRSLRCNVSAGRIIGEIWSVGLIDAE